MSVHVQVPPAMVRHRPAADTGLPPTPAAEGGVGEDTEGAARRG